MAKITKTVSDSKPRSSVWLERLLFVILGMVIATAGPAIYQTLNVRFGKSELERGMERINAWSDCRKPIVDRTGDRARADAECGKDPQEFETKQQR